MRFNLDSRVGRFGARALGISGGSGFHAAGMNELWQGVGMGRGGLFDFASYKGVPGMGFAAWSPGARTVGAEVARHRAMGEAMRNAVANPAVRRSVLGQAAWRGIQPAFTAYATYAGYKDGGAIGAAKGFGTAMAFNYLWGAAFKAMGSFGVPVALIAGTAAATYVSLEGGRQRIKRTRAMEMGSPVVDPFGNAATMRQRSVQALMNSQINGRSALGTEAQLMHVPMLRG